MKFVAFLRGINLGRRQIKMAELKDALERLGYENVQTILASGNVVFDSKISNADKLKNEIEGQIKKRFGFEVHALLRSEKEIDSLVKGDPFKDVKMPPGTRLYVTFLARKPKSKLKIPYRDGDFTLREITSNHLVSVLGPKAKSTEVMDFLGKEFGKEITTRNWNTVMKIHRTLQKK